MRLQSLFTSTAVPLVLIAALLPVARVQAGAFTQPSGLPVATVVTAYLDIATGNLQMNPVGRNISSFIFNANIINPNASTPGPFVYNGSGTKVSTQSIAKSYPQGSYPFAPTIWAAQTGAAFYDLNSTASLGFTANNSASDGHPYDVDGAPVKGGYWNLPWSFGVTAPTLNSDSLVRSTFVADTTGDVGYGAGKAQFTFTVDGVVGHNFGEVIPYSSVVVPEPSSIVMAGMGIGLLGLAFGRRRNA